jgi:hypothetical protein
MNEGSYVERMGILMPYKYLQIHILPINIATIPLLFVVWFIGQTGKK